METTTPIEDKKETFTKSFNISLPNLSGIWAMLSKLGSKIDIWHIFFVNLAMRLFLVSTPNDGGMVFDEIHYIKATRAILEGIAANAEHPPLVKLMVGLFIKIFGDYWFSWRMPIILFSMFIPIILYRIVMDLTSDKKKALFVAAFSCFDIILFIHGNIYMLEMPSLVLALVAAMYMIEKKYGKSALAMGFACLCNEKAVFALLGMAIYQFWMLPRTMSGKETGKKVLTYLTICAIIGFGGLWISDTIWKPSKTSSSNVVTNVIVYTDAEGNPVNTVTTTVTNVDNVYITDPLDHLLFMFGYYTGLSNNIPQIPETWRPAWSWIGPWGPNWDHGPAYLSTSVSYGDKHYMTINYIGQTPFFIWWMFLPVLVLGLFVVKTTETKFITAWMIGNYLPWLLWDGIRQNIPFNHYFMFTSIGCCMGIPFFWGKVLPKYQYQATTIHLIATIIFFFMYFPLGIFR